VRVLWLAVVAMPWVADTLVRVVLAMAACSRRDAAVAAPRVRRWLALVPARGEGKGVEPTLVALRAAAEDEHVRVVLLLDGPDDEAAGVARRTGAEVAVKVPAGPSKARALAWAVDHLSGELDACDGVLVVDVGSRVSPEFFHRLAWPADADGVQAVLAGSGSGSGPGTGAALSERSAQERMDRGRQALGWSVRLRGTGTALTPEAFRAVASRLATSVEDLEASLLLAADGRRLVLGPREAAVADEKPRSIPAAARQRARWLRGQAEVVTLRAGALLRLIRRRPLEGAAFAVEVVSRPMSLTALARLGLAAVLVAAGTRSGPHLAELSCSAVLVGSIVVDLLLLGAARPAFWRGAAGLALAWLGAVALLPRALSGWLRARRP
jgi:cellulose synthase/poly-beta-1,6-N-acetylglucosamine synthase-like glycosyltransferase